VFLDEVGELPHTIQVKLLRVLEEQQVLRVGGRVPRSIDVRFVSATHRDIEAEVARGAFRQDLYFRLNGVTLTIPPLRERESDVAPLARLFAAKASKGFERAEIPAVSEEALAVLEKCVGNQTYAARMLGISRRTLVSRIEEYNLPRPRKPRPKS
jgi:two-component system, NtrC family, response regulator AtoC